MNLSKKSIDKIIIKFMINLHKIYSVNKNKHEQIITYTIVQVYICQHEQYWIVEKIKYIRNEI